ncbi:hypothetical protein M0811_00681 [Anaeramoeba ignava]|uniref:Uncharacterized protein n=1 Tax=Anaeramoeba ignava TaxID=1746090 RepID=A0A9Q0RC05_ANAIG|nr:hypothetical protein M0811_00681 [Anaeramoeba ignava]
MSKEFSEFLTFLDAKIENISPKNKTLSFLHQSAHNLIFATTQLNISLRNLEPNTLTLPEIFELIQTIFISLKKLGNIVLQIEILQEKEIDIIEKEYVYRTNKLEEDIHQFEKEIESLSNFNSNN